MERSDNEIDLSQLTPNEPILGPRTATESDPYDPAEDRERIRGRLAQILVWTLVAVVGAVAIVGIATAFRCLWSNMCSEEITKLETVSSLVTLIVTPLVGLVGAVTGFYYGEKAGK